MDILNHINNLPLQAEEVILATLVVVSLYTNIPQDEALDVNMGGIR